MFKFNSNHIVTGQIKQVLNAFNLPSYKIYKAKHYKYFLDHGVESPELSDGLYIKWDRVYEYKNGKWGKDFDTYGYNRKYLNHTKTFPIVNNIYDSDTHEYLGEFLRFQRDYLGVDLMPLYNCFSNRVCNNINLSIYRKDKQYKEVLDENGNVVLDENLYPVITEDEVVTKIRRAFYSNDKDFVIYMIPIKYFQEYTIALDCSTGAEICCGLFDDYIQDFDENRALIGGQFKIPPVDMSQFISNQTYRKLPCLRFNEPILWEGITPEHIDELVQECLINCSTSGDPTVTREHKRECYRQRLLSRESMLKLFLKIPVNCKTSITILEGDYRDFNNYKYAPEEVEIPYTYYVETYDENGDIITDEKGNPVLERKTHTSKKSVWTKYQNRSITNYETSLTTEDGFKSDGIKRVQLPDIEDRPFRPISPLQLLMFNTKESYPFSSRLVEYITGNVITAWDENTDNIRRAQKVLQLNNNDIALPGAWDDTMRRMFYDYMMNGKPTGDKFTFDINHDTLGYVDKDVEKFYTAWDFEYCVDENGNRIPLTEKVKKADGTYEEDPLTGKPKEVPLYRLVNHLLTEEEKKLLLEKREFILTANDLGTMPLYKQRFVPKGTISSIDIYED